MIKAFKQITTKYVRYLSSEKRITKLPPKRVVVTGAGG